MKVVKGYVHHDGSIGVLAMFEVGTDFTARTIEFKTFAEAVCMSLAFHTKNEPDPDATPPGAVLSTPYATVEWVGPAVGTIECQTLAAALAAAKKQFHEPIQLLSFQSLLA